MRVSILKSFFLAALLLLFPSCSQEKSIVGYWQWGNAQSFWEFRADGSCQTHGDSASKVTGRYSFSGRGKLKIHINGEAQPHDISISIKGDEMTFAGGPLGPIKLHRVEASQVRTSSPAEELSRMNEWISPATNQSPRPSP